MGTLDYMAPEQASDTHSVDIRADLYSLGCTLYHLLAGSPPFSGSQYSTILKKMMAHANSSVPPLSEIRSDVPVDLLSVLDRLLAKGPSERFATPAEVAAALLPFADGSNLPELLNRVAVANADLEHLDTLQQSTVNPVSSALSDTINPVAEPFAPTIIVDRKPHSSAVSQGGDRKTRHRIWQSLGGLGGVLLLGIVFFVGTGEGRVELTVNHKDIQVSIDGEPQQIRVMDGANGEYRIELPNIPAGRRELIVSRDGFSSETRHFWINRNGERAFEMKLAPEPGTNAAQETQLARKETPPNTATKPSTSNLGPTENILPGLIPRPATIPGIKRWNIESRAIRSAVNRIAYSPDGQLLACGEHAGRVRLYDVAANKLINVLSTKSSVIDSLAWSSDGERLAIGFQHQVQVWSREGEFLWERKTFGTPFALSWAQDGSQLAIRDNSAGVTFVNWDGAESRRIETGSCANGFLSFAADMVVVGTRDGQLVFVNHKEGAVIRSVDVHEAAISCLVWNPQTGIIASADVDGRVCFTQSDGTVIASHREHVGVVYSLAWHPKGTSLVSVDPSENIIHWDNQGNKLRTLKSPGGRVPTAIAWHLDGQTYSVTGGAHQVVHLASDADEPVAPTAGINLRLTDIEWNQSGTRFAMGSRDSVLYVFSSDLGDSMFIGTSGDVRGVAWSPDDEQIATADGSSDGSSVHLWNLSTRRESDVLTPLGGNSPLYGLSWSPLSNALAVGSANGTTTIWNFSEPTSTSLRNHSGLVKHVDWVPGTRILVTAGRCSSVEFGEPGKAVLKVDATRKNEVRALSCSPNGRRIAAVSDHKIFDLWNLDGTRLATATPYEERYLFSDALGWSNDSESLLAIREDGMLVRLSEDGNVLGDSPIHHALPWKIAVHPEKDIALSCDEVGTVVKWSTETLDPEWVLVTMPQGESLQFSASGELLRGDRELFEREFVYVIEDETGHRHLLTPSEFNHRRALPGDFSVDDARARRRLAKWIHDNGGKLMVGGVDVSSSLRPEHKLNHIQVSLSGDQINDEHVNRVAQLIPSETGELELFLYDTNVPSASFEVFSEIPQLTVLHFHGSTVDPTDFGKLRTKSLWDLSLAGVTLTKPIDRSLDLSGLPNLLALTLIVSNKAPEFRFSDTHLQHVVQSVDSLTGIDLRPANITDEGLKSLRKFPGLRHLGIYSPALSDEAVRIVSRNHQRLEDLKLGGTGVSNLAFDHLRELTDLRYLDLQGSPNLTLDGIERLSNLKYLDRLILSGTPFGDDDVPWIK